MGLQRIFAQVIDSIAGFFGRLLIGRSPAVPNTFRQLSTYRSRPQLDLFPAPAELPPVTVLDRWSLAGLECRHLTFPSHHQPLAPDFAHRHHGEYQLNGRVFVRWLRHTDAGNLDRARRPTLIFLHSWMQPDTFLEEITLLPAIAKTLGVNVARLQLPYHGRRRPECSLFHGEYFFTADLVRTIEAIRQTVFDTRTLISWLEREDPGPIGVMGMSLGGMMALAVTCLDDRLAFSIPVGAHLDLAGVLEDASLLRPMRRELQSHGWQPDDVHRFTSTLGLNELAPKLAKERILFVAGKYDRLLHARRIEALWDRWDRPPIHWYEGGHLGIFTHFRGSLRAMREFLVDLGIAENRLPASADHQDTLRRA